MSYRDLFLQKRASCEAIRKVACLMKQAANSAVQGSARLRTGKSRSQALGMLTSGALSATTLAILGALMGGKKGAVIGAGAGLYGNLLAQGIGGTVAAVKGPRTLKQQADYDASEDGDTAANYLVPGMAGYNLTRSRLTNFDEQRAVQRQKLMKG